MSTVSVGVLESNFSQPGAAIQETSVQGQQVELGSRGLSQISDLQYHCHSIETVNIGWGCGSGQCTCSTGLDFHAQGKKTETTKQNRTPPKTGLFFFVCLLAFLFFLFFCLC